MIINPKPYQHKNNHKEERPRGFFIRKLLETKIKPSLTQIKERLEPIRKSKRLSKIRESFKEVINSKKFKTFSKHTLNAGKYIFFGVIIWYCGFWLINNKTNNKVVAAIIVTKTKTNSKSIFNIDNLKKVILLLNKPIELPIFFPKLKYSALQVITTHLTSKMLSGIKSEKFLFNLIKKSIENAALVSTTTLILNKPGFGAIYNYIQVYKSEITQAILFSSATGEQIVENKEAYLDLLHHIINTFLYSMTSLIRSSYPDYDTTEVIKCIVSPSLFLDFFYGKYRPKSVTEGVATILGPLVVGNAYKLEKLIYKNKQVYEPLIYQKINEVGSINPFILIKITDTILKQQ